MSQNNHLKQCQQSQITNQEIWFQCPICLMHLILPISLSCGHTFCQPCIKSKNFKFVKNVCPICRKKIEIRLNQYSLNILLDKILMGKNKNNKEYIERVQAQKKLKYPKIIRVMDQVKKWIKQKLPWIIIACLCYHLLKVKINSFTLSWEGYKKKALQIANSIKGQDSLDFKFILFSQFIRVLFSHIVIP